MSFLPITFEKKISFQKLSKFFSDCQHECPQDKNSVAWRVLSNKLRLYSNELKKYPESKATVL